MLARSAPPTLFGNPNQGRAATYSLLAMLLLIATLSAIRMGSPGSPTLPNLPASLPDLGRLPLNFEPNVGQSDPSALYLTRAPGGNLYFTHNEVVLSLHGGTATSSSHDENSSNNSYSSEVVHLQFIGANSDVQLERGPSLPGKINYFLGSNPAQWRTDVPTYSDIAYRGLYPGIDLIYGGLGGQLKGTYTLSAGADPTHISWRYTGASTLKIGDAGSLLITLPGTQVLTEQAPLAWQEIDGQRASVQVAYTISQDGSVGFSLGEYNRALPLTIDPTLILPYSTYLGGSDQDTGYGIAADDTGNIYVTGETYSYDFPTRNPISEDRNGTDAFISKINTTLSGDPSLIYSTYLAGSGDDAGHGVAIDSSGNAYVVGSTTSSNFPIVNQYQVYQGSQDAFVLKLGATGSTLPYSTYLGGSGLDDGLGISVGNAGNAYVTGYTESTNFPVLNQYQGLQSGGDVFVTRLNTTLVGNASLLYSTYLGNIGTESGQSIAVGTSGTVYVTGYTTSSNFPLLNEAQSNQPSVDAFVTRLNTNLSGNASLIYSTYLGGDFIDQGYGIAFGGSGIVYITGSTSSSDFPNVRGYQPSQPGDDAFVTRLDTATAGYFGIGYSTYLGGSGNDNGFGIAADGANNAYVTGFTTSTNFPTRDNYQNDQSGDDAFVARIDTTQSSNASLIYSTYLGGEGNDHGQSIAIDSLSNVYVTGYTASTGFPTNNQYQSDQIGQDAFVSKLTYANPTATPTTSPTSTRTRTVTPTSTATATRTPTPDPCAPSWAVVVSPNPAIDNNSLTGVAVVGPNDVWAVGNYYNGSVFQTLTEHWNGTAWTIIASPNPGSTYNELDVVAVAGPNDVWAIGYYDNAGPDQTLILHWNGTAWSVIASPNVGADDNELEGVAVVGPNDVWAVGYYRNAGNIAQTLTEHWNGTAWTVVSSPNSGASHNSLRRVAVVAANDVWAIGIYYPGNIGQTLTEHWNGTAWSVVPSPNVGASDNVLTGLATVGPTSVWAVGYYHSGNIGQTLIEHWNGTAWTVVPSPNVGAGDNELEDVAVAGSGDVWAVGYYHNAVSQTLTEHWNGTAWTVISSPNSGTGYNLLLGVAVAGPNDIWAVGNYDNNALFKTLTEHYRSACATVTPTVTPTRTGTTAPTNTATRTATTPPVNTATRTATQLPSATPTRTNTISPSNTPTRTLTPAPTQTPGGPTATPTPTNTSTATFTNTPTLAPTNTTAPTHTTAPTNTSAPTSTPTRTNTPLPTQTPGGPTATTEPSNTPSATNTIVPTDTPAVPTDTPAVPTPTVTVCSIEFTDVPPGSTFYNYVRCMACRGIINGYTSGCETGDPCFRPSNNVTRGQLSKIVANAAGFSEPTGAQQFEDVPSGSTFFDFVWRLYSRGYVNGYPCGTAPAGPCVSPNNYPYFLPNGNATRGQISKIVSNAANLTDPPGNQLFEDVPPTHTFYDFIQRLANQGVMSGYACGGPGEPCVEPLNLPYFRPGNNATRGQTSKIVSNTFFPNCDTPWIRR